MHLLLSLLVAAAPQYVRVAQKQAAPEPNSGTVWVFFTDKGIYSDAQCRAATDALELAAAAPVRDRRQHEAVRGFDFDDVPVRDEYVRRVERLGARLRTTSRWLNGASFDMTPELARRVYALPFVYDVRPVGYRSEPDWDVAVPIPRPEPGSETRGLDTAKAHRFWGAAWDQAQMMGVPEVAGKGFYGDGVRLAIFDTGLKLKNRAVTGMSLYRQHDFISGDNFYCGRSSTGWTPAAIPGLRYLGLVKDPALSALPPDSSVGPGWRLLVVFAADSFSYPTTNMSKRGVFYSHSDDEGANWSEPELLFLSRPEDQTFASLSLARRRYVTYFAWDELSQNGGNPSSKVYCGWFVGTGWVGQRDLGAGRWPHAAALEDSLYLVYSASDSILLFRKGNVTMAEPVWVTNTQVAAPEPVTDPQVCPGLAGRVNLLCCGRYSGRIYRYQSVDGGVTFSRMDDLAASAASMPRLFGEGRDKLLLFKDNTPAPFTRLSAMRTANWGEEWYVPVGVTESTLTLGSYSAAIWGPDTASQATVLYESQGLLRRATTPLWGGTWAEPQTVIDTAGFCYSPLLADVNGSLAAVWFKRGDDNTVWEASDTMHFSRDQSDHGTRMASLIAGWLPYSMVGIAPAVDLIVAKTEFHKSRGNRYYEYNVEEDTYVEALEWAEAAGADIVSTSLGYRGWYRSDQFDGRTAPVSIAASLAAKRGLLICTAMGNRDSSRTPWPRAYIVAPGDADGIITCGGIQRSGLPWRGTGIGPTADGRIKPDFAALSDTVAVAAPDPPTDTSSRIDGSVGTSCATALIAGACALIKEAHPDWNAESIIAALRVTSTRSVPDCTLGYGVPRVDSVFRLYPPDVNVEGVPHDRIEIVFPNPFVPDGYGHERVYFALGLASATPRASISIYTVNGTLIDTIGLAADLLTHPGRYGTDGDVATLDRLGAFWDGRNSDGRPVAAGLYLAVLRTTFGRHATRFALVR